MGVCHHCCRRIPRDHACKRAQGTTVSTACDTPMHWPVGYAKREGAPSYFPVVRGNRPIRYLQPVMYYTIQEYLAHYHHERNHQGRGNVLLVPSFSQKHPRAGPMQCRERLGGLLNYYTHEAA